ncbi:MAG: glycosyltransferase, partial [Acidobacteriota bacterium]|nr:glycosyltransferase [Acidobacteriota bacterium]
SEYPEVRIRVVTDIEQTANGKVGALSALAREARHAILVVNDSDIAVEPDYLSTVIAPLEQPGTGLVTCLYRARSGSLPARFEALGIATDFAPSVLVARLLGVAEFALGSSMAFRAEDLRKIGSFDSLKDYLADDYQLGLRITRLGLRVVFAETVVETNLGAGSWSEVWKHQVRWSRTIRVLRPGGYYGYIVTQTTFWAMIAWCAGARRIAMAAFACRMAAGMAAALRVLRDRNAARDCWLIPFRDLFGAAIWATGLFGNTVEWRGERLWLSPDGRITRHPLG